MELAPIVGMSDVIVDLVSSGKTLEANNLIALEKISDISSRLIINQASLKIKRAQLKPLIENFSKVVRSEEHTSELQSRSDIVCRLLLEKKKRSRVKRKIRT